MRSIEQRAHPSAQEAQGYQRSLEAAEEQELVRILKDRGMHVNEVNNVSAFAELTSPLRNLYIKKLGQPAKELFDKIDALRDQ